MQRVGNGKVTSFRNTVIFLVFFPSGSLWIRHRSFDKVSIFFDSATRSIETSETYYYDAAIRLTSSEQDPNQPVIQKLPPDALFLAADNDIIAPVIEGDERPDSTNNSKNSTPQESCGWNSSLQAPWTPNSKDENVLFEKVMACHRKLSPRKPEQWDQKERPLPSSLRCGDSIMDEVDSILSCYDKIVFFGDSIQRQQFFTLSCILNPSLSLKNIMPNPTKDEYKWKDDRTNTLIMFHGAPKSVHKNGAFK
eukprot:CAMPEP_0113645244 /NCGR_PEP_ID=MMETSP0017_2-20120614/23834_1 /TAXON_ID=2856 /ORGANISM="Cylindrotheca closterium" /LENGTH=250 /DNA_ID=CAMNT_0000556941 /DNA_START=145 /DNA_END=894 /DNA_ORIENTATION=+ /assembly_acc=CAM_ASM_000147